MFNVKSLNQNTSDKTTVSSGITFGSIGIPIYFEVTAIDDPKKPLMIKFIVVSSSDHESFEFSWDSIIDNKMTAKFNLPDKAPSGVLKVPANLANKGEYSLNLMFALDSIQSSGMYRMTYEFYYGKLSDKKEGDQK